jgi:PUA domain protein
VVSCRSDDPGRPRNTTYTHTDCLLTVLSPLPYSLSREHVSILALHGQPLFFQHFDGPYFPTLRLLQQCASLLVYSSVISIKQLSDECTSIPCIFADPDLLPKVQVDKGAIKFVLAGANIMW